MKKAKDNLKTRLYKSYFHMRLRVLWMDGDREGGEELAEYRNSNSAPTEKGRSHDLGWNYWRHRYWTCERTKIILRPIITSRRSVFFMVLPTNSRYTKSIDFPAISCA